MAFFPYWNIYIYDIYKANILYFIYRVYIIIKYICNITEIFLRTNLCVRNFYIPNYFKVYSIQCHHPLPVLVHVIYLLSPHSQRILITGSWQLKSVTALHHVSSSKGCGFCDLSSFKAAIEWTVSPQKSYVEALTPKVTVSRNRAFKRQSR